MRPDPAADSTGKMSVFIQRQLRGYEDGDPVTRQAAALPLLVFKVIASCSSSHKILAVSQLILGAFFFAMRSCEYVRTKRVGKTEKLKVKNLKFYKGRRLLSHSEDLESASSISITFVFQKNRTKMQTITQQRTGLRLCPVRCWAKLVKRILSYAGTSGESPVNVVRVNGELVEVTDEEVTSVLRATVTAIGEQRLGFSSDRVSTHSVRASTVMALLLAQVKPLTIMWLGRWKSLAFTRYVRTQVLEAFSGLSVRMAAQSDFFTATHKLSDESMEELRNHLSLSSAVAHAAPDVAPLNGPRSTPEDHTQSSFNVWA